MVRASFIDAEFAGIAKIRVHASKQECEIIRWSGGSALVLAAETATGFKIIHVQIIASDGRLAQYFFSQTDCRRAL